MVRDRPAHADSLRRQLAEANSRIQEIAEAQRRNGVEKDRRGVAITATSQSEESMRVGSMSLRSRGVQLLGLRSGDNGKQTANLFVTKKGIESLERALVRYVEYEDGRKPQRFNFFETVGSFRLTTVADLWGGDRDELPPLRKKIEWEVWVREDALATFRNCAEELGIEIVGRPASFVDTAVFNVVANTAELERLISASAAVVELRSASSFVSDYLDFDPEERFEALGEVLELVSPPEPDCAVTTLFDTGVNFANPLVGIALDQANCQAIEPDWPVADHDGHGTKMAGIALYRDLEKRIDEGLPFVLENRLESIVVTAPSGSESIPAYDALGRALGMIDDDGVARILCLSQTAPADFTDGKQSGLSGVVDRASWNGGEDTRLFCVAAGNVQANVDKRFPIGAYDQRNAKHRLESPAQAVNALTVGAATHRCSSDWDGLADEGDLCPSSRTSQQWNVHYAYKPDIVMEGGNHELDGDEPFSFQSNASMLLTAARTYPGRPFGWTGETSAATARAAGLATALKSRYPDFRAETLRAMMVHCAEWSPAMLARRSYLQKVGLSKADAQLNMLQCYGWGIPDEERIFRSAGDALTLVIEDALEPYREGSGGATVLKEMKYFRLPWPRASLQSLGQQQVEVRCTLSYFAEPDPHATSRSRLDRYASHRLRFSLKAAGDSHLEAQQRVNILAGEEDVEDFEDEDVGYGIIGTGQQLGWLLGDRARRRGTIHHDIWTGPASELADRDGVSVFPVKGWWADRRSDEYRDVPVAFTLVVSIRTTDTEVDLYADANAKVKPKNRVTSRAQVRI